MRPKGNVRGPLRVVVSGGMGSGKTTVLEILRDSGAVVIEADRIGHAVLEQNGPAFPAVSERWPVAVKDGRIDRRRLGAIVFSDTEQLAELESFTHPHIRAAIEEKVAAAGERDVVVELPLTSDLLGSGWLRLVVDAPRAIRLQRTVARGMDAADASNRLAAQPDRTGWLETADVVVENTGSLAELEEEVRRIWDELHSQPPE